MEISKCMETTTQGCVEYTCVLDRTHDGKPHKVLAGSRIFTWETGGVPSVEGWNPRKHRNSGGLKDGLAWNDKSLIPPKRGRPKKETV